MDDPNQPLLTDREQQQIEQDQQSYEMLIDVLADIIIENGTDFLDEIKKEK